MTCYEPADASTVAGFSCEGQCADGLVASSIALIGTGHECAKSRQRARQRTAWQAQAGAAGLTLANLIRKRRAAHAQDWPRWTTSTRPDC